VPCVFLFPLSCPMCRTEGGQLNSRMSLDEHRFRVVYHPATGRVHVYAFYTAVNEDGYALNA
jgi:hypothetical protein